MKPKTELNSETRKTPTSATPLLILLILASSSCATPVPRVTKYVSDPDTDSMVCGHYCQPVPYSKTANFVCVDPDGYSILTEWEARRLAQGCHCDSP